MNNESGPVTGKYSLRLISVASDGVIKSYVVCGNLACPLVASFPLNLT